MCGRRNLVTVRLLLAIGYMQLAKVVPTDPDPTKGGGPRC
jgi:hypothetical protein